MPEKFITIPLGMVKEDFSPVGDWRTVDALNREYAFSNILLSKVRNIVGGPYTVGNVCLSPNINQWAAFKPWRRGSTGTDHGMIIDAMQNIVYDKPTITSGFYLGDFAGYNHYARLPGVITSTDILTFQTGFTMGFSRLLALPEFDLRTLNSFIQGVITTVNGESRYLALTDSAVNSREFPAMTPQVLCSDANTISFNVTVELGYLDGVDGTINPYCNFPRVNTINIVAYNISAPQITGLYREIDNTIGMGWTHRDPMVANGYVRIERSIDSGAYVTVYQGTDTIYVESNVLESSDYTFRLTFQRQDGTWGGSSTVTVTTPGPGEGGGGAV